MCLRAEFNGGALKFNRIKLYLGLEVINIFIILFSLACLMFAAYRGYSVIIFAPLIIIFALVVTDISIVAPVFSEVFMVRLAFFVQNYFPVFLLGAIFGKFFEMSGASRSVALQVVRVVGSDRSLIALVLLCSVLTYAGVSLFVVVFTVYPFAAELFKTNNIPKRLIPASMVLGAFSFTMDALPGSPQILNVIPTTFFGTTVWAAPILGLLTSGYILTIGLFFLENSRLKAQKRGEGYGENHYNEPFAQAPYVLPSAWISILPLVLVGLINFALSHYIPIWYGPGYDIVLPSSNGNLVAHVSKMAPIWAVEGGLLTGIGLLSILFFKRIYNSSMKMQVNAAVGGSVFAALSSATEFGFGSVISILPGFLILEDVLKLISDPLLNQAITINLLAGITASASGGLSIALGAMAHTFIDSANAAQIPMEVLHRVASLAAGGMDTLPHNGAVIVLLAVTGLTHVQSYRYIFGVTLIKVSSCFFAIFAYYALGVV